jgi:hypothetical protein
VATGKPEEFSEVVWSARPWIIPTIALRSIVILAGLIVIIAFELNWGLAFNDFFGLPIYEWTVIGVAVAWFSNVSDQVIYWVSHVYTLEKFGLENRVGVVDLEEIMITPQIFSDLVVKQSVGGKLFGYGQILVKFGGGRKTTLYYVRSPFRVADMIRKVLGRPVVGFEQSV